MTHHNHFDQSWDTDIHNLSFRIFGIDLVSTYNHFFDITRLINDDVLPTSSV